MSKHTFAATMIFVALFIGLGWLASSGNVAAIVTLSIAGTVFLIGLGALIALASVGRGGGRQSYHKDIESLARANRLLVRQNEQLAGMVGQRQAAPPPVVLGESRLVSPFDETPLLGEDERLEQ